MILNTTQTERALQIWQRYLNEGERFINASQEYSHEELDQHRREVIPEVMGWITQFANGEVPLEEFKTAVDGINKRHRLWGFKGVNGQMYFNMLTKKSLAGDRLAELDGLLKMIFPVPSGETEIRDKMDKLVDFTRGLGQYSQDARTAPKVGSIPFFLSYFWQIQDPGKFPVYYTSMVNVLRDEDIWFPTRNVADDYVEFRKLNYHFLESFGWQSSRGLHLWDVEHAFWFQSQQSVIESAEEETVETPGGVVGEERDARLPDSYIPPVVSILPRLAYNDEALAELCRRAGKAIEKVFEERIAILFQMMGYEVELLGQGRGRTPDGVATSREFRYAIIYDAKVRQNNYTMGTDERAIREYINVTGERLRRQGIRNIYFMVVSSDFSGDHDDTIRSLKIETDVREVLLVTADALLAMLEGKLRSPDIHLGPDNIQRLLASSGILAESEIREFLEI